MAGWVKLWTAAAMVSVLHAVTLASKPPSEAPKAAVALPGDDQLTCPQILAEAQARNREFDDLLEEINRLKVPMSARTMALLAAHEAIATAAAFGPAGSEAAGGVATAAAATSYMESARADDRKAAGPLEQRIEFAMGRGDYLNELYGARCVAKTARKGPRPANCPVLETERARLRKEMEAGVAEITTMAQNHNPAGTMARAKAAGTVAGLAGALIPGASGLIGSSLSAATSAALRAPLEALNAKSASMMKQQEALAKIESEYEEKCGP